MVPTHDITQLLRRWSDGDGDALETLTPLLYTELHRMAHRYMRRERSGHTLQTTALINEAYVRLIDWKRIPWHNRAQFFALAARLMRQILVDWARSRHYAKRGGAEHVILPLDEVGVVAPERARDIVALDEALRTLSALDPRKSQVVELRFFGGLTVEETADVLSVSARTVLREWDLAKAWLGRELNREKTT